MASPVENQSVLGKGVQHSFFVFFLSICFILMFMLIALVLLRRFVKSVFFLISMLQLNI